MLTAGQLTRTSTGTLTVDLAAGRLDRGSIAATSASGPPARERW